MLSYKKKKKRPIKHKGREQRTKQKTLLFHSRNLDLFLHVSTKACLLDRPPWKNTAELEIVRRRKWSKCTLSLSSSSGLFFFFFFTGLTGHQDSLNTVLDQNWAEVLEKTGGLRTLTLMPFSPSISVSSLGRAHSPAMQHSHGHHKCRFYTK